MEGWVDGWMDRLTDGWMMITHSCNQSMKTCTSRFATGQKMPFLYHFPHLLLMLKLKLQDFGHFMWRADSLEKTLMQGKIEGRRRRGWQRMRWLDSINDSTDMSLSKLQEMVKEWESLACCIPWGSQWARHNFGSEQKHVLLGLNMKNWDSAFDYMCKLPYKLSIKLYWKHIFTRKKKIG